MIPFRTIESFAPSQPVERMRVCLGDGAVRRPARVAEAVVRVGAVRAGLVLQVLEIPDRADVVEAVVLAQRDPGRVVASVLEALEALQEESACTP